MRRVTSHVPERKPGDPDLPDLTHWTHRERLSQLLSQGRRCWYEATALDCKKSLEYRGRIHGALVSVRFRNHEGVEASARIPRPVAQAAHHAAVATLTEKRAEPDTRQPLLVLARVPRCPRGPNPSLHSPAARE